MDKLNDKIFDKNGKVIPMVRKKLLQVAHKVANDVATLVKIKHIYFTGSLAGYNWNALSDIDVHVVVDILEKHSDNTLNEYFDLICKLFNSQHNIFIKGYKVEVNMKEVETLLHNKAVYDLIDNKWVVKPVKILRNADDEQVINLTKYYQKRIDDIITNNGSVQKAKELKNEIKELRKEGLSSEEGEFSVGNLVFKKLRNTDYLAKIFDYWNKLEDQELSLESFKVIFNTSL
jgi:hypothetical protein